MEIFFIVIIAYLVFVYVILRIIIPNSGFKKSSLPKVIPQEFAMKIHEINTNSKDYFDYLQEAFNYITTTFYGKRLETIFLFRYAFEDVYKYKPGYLPCTSLNYLVRIFLIKSGRFIEEDIKVKTVPLNFFIHQYLQVKVDGKWIDVDPWSAHLEIPLGKHSFLFAI
jgi:hypothetical protein